MLCAANMAKESQDIESWTLQCFEGCAQYLNERPFASYTLCYLKHHINGCQQDANVRDITSQFVDELTNRPAVYLLENWVSSSLNKTLPSDKYGVAAKEFRNSVLHAAVRKGLCTAAEILFIVGANANTRDQEGGTPLSKAAAYGHEEMVKLLLEKGADLDSKDSEYGWTLLSWAARYRNGAVIKLLREKGAEKNPSN